MFALFDLPVDTKEHRKQYAQFRKTLLKLGFTMLQFSVYAKHLQSEDAAMQLGRIVGAAVPPKGQVRVLTVTDRQYGKMDVYFGRKRVEVEDAPEQIGLF
jgi:CRISPR-associated protein Cas2